MTQERKFVVAVIPSRFASSRFPGKPLVDLNGKTMVERVYERTLAARLVDSVVVATDDERILNTLNNTGCHVVLTDPRASTGSDRVAAAAVDIEADIIVNIQGDQPLIPPGLIDEVIQALVDDAEAEVTTPVTEIISPEEILNPNVVKVVSDLNKRAMYFSRAPIPYLRDIVNRDEWVNEGIHFKHIGIFAYRRNILRDFVSWNIGKLEQLENLEQLRFLENGVNIRVVHTAFDSISVDTPEDAKKVKEILTEKKDIRYD